MVQNKNNEPIVVTLDAGGTNFVFGAMQGGKPCTESITLPSMAHDLDLCLGNLVKGFEQIIAALPERPVAISFAFPGPADYRNGVIGGYLPNFPSFRDGVALGPMLEERFGIPVFINNDGDLFAYGEALCGVLPEINNRLNFMMDVGLGYLTLNRLSNTLSGGESQRIRLATQIGSKLVNVLYILDEPTTGLHAADVHKLIEVLNTLADEGNTVIVICNANFIIYKVRNTPLELQTFNKYIKRYSTISAESLFLLIN